ncbi:MAG: histidine--tRNA ligase [Cyclobacteriaceae bacterium]|nr:histidine--tRNA ligase [Cyclobacteriaceae bacterium]
MDKPALPKGTRDFGPVVMARRNYLTGVIRQVFERFGFQPLETPAMENLSTLLGKYGEEGDQLLFRILDNGDFLKDVPDDVFALRDARKLSQYIAGKGLRYDLTVPFARYVVMNRSDIPMPFRRYQIQPVWRADRPQKGRYREFYQCDADVVGTDSLLCETEIVLMIDEVFGKLGLKDYAIKINHRDILNHIARATGAAGRENDLFVALDKLDKIGEEGVREELSQRGFATSVADKLFDFIRTGAAPNGLTQLSKDLPESRGLNELQQVFAMLRLAGNDLTHAQFDVSLARGLTYYTGCIFEVKISNVAVGSVCGGGRYDNLTQAFGSKEKLSGVGISFGIDRIYDALAELNLFPSQVQSSVKVLVCHMDEGTFRFGLQVVQQLRQAGVASELYPDITKLRKQLDYANRRQIPFAAVIGPDEMSRGTVALKNLTTGEQETLTTEKLIEKLKP